MVSRCIATIDQEGGAVHSLAVMKNRNQFVSAAYRLDPSGNHYLRSIKLWDLVTGQCARTFTIFFRYRGSPCRLMCLDDESFVCYFVHIEVLVLYNIASDNYAKIIELDRTYWNTTPLAILDRDKFLTGSLHGDVKVCSFETAECQRILVHMDVNYPMLCCISKFDDESFLCGFRRKVLLCNVETGEVMKSFDVYGETHQIAVIDSERFLTVQHLYQRGNVNVWNANSGELIRSVSTDSKVLQAIPVHGHGVLFAYQEDANIELWDNEMENLKKRFLGHTGDVRSMEVVHSNTFISGSSDGTIKIWDLTRWSDLKTLICLRELVKLGRAEEVPFVGRDEFSPFLYALVCETTPDDIFKTVLSFLA